MVVVGLALYCERRALSTIVYSSPLHCYHFRAQSRSSIFSFAYAHTIMPPSCTEEGCKKVPIKKIKPFLCPDHANKKYGQCGTCPSGGRGLLYRKYVVNGDEYRPTSNGKSGCALHRLMIPFEACMSHETLVKLSPEEIQAMKNLYNENRAQVTKAQSVARAAARAANEPDAEPLRVFRKTGASSRAPGESGRGECAVSGCTRNTHHRVEGISCDCCAVRLHGKWDPETSTFILEIPGTEYQASITILYIGEDGIECLFSGSRTRTLSF